MIYIIILRLDSIEGGIGLKDARQTPAGFAPPPLPIIKNIICVLVYLESVLDAGGSYQLHLVLDPTGERRH